MPVEKPPLESPDSSAARQRHIQYRRRVFLTIGLSIAGFYAIILGYHFLTPEPSKAASSSVLEQCRELCLQYGLIPTGHVANDAKAYLNSARTEKLSAPLREILSDPHFVVAESKEHALLKRPALDFQLSNHKGKPVSLAELNREGPVVLVFYMGYDCSHCVAQLFGLNEDLAHFRELGARIVAISADPPEETAAKFAEYGAFDFTVLSDPGNQVAQAYGVYRPETNEIPADLKHGTFLIGPTGKVIFATYGYKPFLDNKSLLYMLSEFSPRTPAGEVVP
jgi:peroxiredoxin